MVCVHHSRLQEARARARARGDWEGLPWGPPENQTSWAADGQGSCLPRGWRSALPESGLVSTGDGATAPAGTVLAPDLLVTFVMRGGPYAPPYPLKATWRQGGAAENG